MRKSATTTTKLNMHRRMMSLIFFLLSLWSPSLAKTSTEWPVFFEHLGHVHSIHNKWDLSLRVHINLPSLEAKVNKILHRLDLLNSDGSVNKTAKEESPINNGGSRLDELSRSWNDQNDNVKRRCLSMKRRAEDLRELSGGGQTTNNHRRLKKRQADGLLKGLFGVAYSSDIDSVSNKVNVLEGRLSGDINDVRAKASNIQSSTQEVLNRQAVELRKMEDTAGNLQRKVISMETNPFMRSSVSDLVHTRNEAYKRLSLEASLAEDRLLEIEAVAAALGACRLSKAVISPKKLRETLTSIELQLPSNHSLLFPSRGTLWPYYSSLAAGAAFDRDMTDVMVSVSVPLVDHSAALSLHRVHNLPIKVKDGYSVLADIATEYLVTDASKQYYLELFKEDFQDCQVYSTFDEEGQGVQEQQFFCGLEPMLRADMARSCVMQLFQGQSDPAWCQTRLKLGLVQPYNRLYNGSWIFSAMTDQVSVVLECPNGEGGGDIVSTPTGLVGFGVIQLGEGCTITSSEFWYAHTLAGTVEVSVGFGGDEDVWKEEEDDGFDEGDYDMSRFENDVILDEEETVATTEEVTTTTENDGGGLTDAEEESVEDEDDDSSVVVVSSTTELSSREDKVSGGSLEVENPANKESSTQIYKDLLIKLKDTLSKNWIQLS